LHYLTASTGIESDPLGSMPFGNRTEGVMKEEGITGAEELD